jgi:hypothetical protein
MAEKVLIAVDREKLDVFLPTIGNGDHLERLSDADLRKVSEVEDTLYAALDRDRDELDPVVRATILKAEHEWIRRAIEKRKLKDPPDEYRIGFNEGLQEALDLIQPDLSALAAIEGADQEEGKRG